MRDQYLSCQLEGEGLVIRIGIETLAFAAEDREPFNIFDEDINEFVQKIKVINDLGWAKDICQALTDEEEDGSSPLTNLLDAAFQTAVDQGSINVWDPDYE